MDNFKKIFAGTFGNLIKQIVDQKVNLSESLQNITSQYILECIGYICHHNFAKTVSQLLNIEQRVIEIIEVLRNCYTQTNETFTGLCR